MAVLPTLTKSWAFQTGAGGTAVAAQGSQLATNRLLLRTLKDEILGLASGGVFTCAFSCNSVTAGTAGDGVDRWTSDANLVSANAGVAHSWFVLESVTGWQILLSCENSSSGLTSISIWQSFGGLFAGGSTTARPTATDERQALATGGWGGGVDAAYRLHVQAPEDGTSLWVGVCTAGTMTHTWDFVQPDLPPGASWDQPLIARVANASANLYINSLLFNTSNYVARRGSTSLTLRNAVIGAHTTGALATLYTAPDPVLGGWPMFYLGFFCDTVANVSAACGVWPDVYHTIDAPTLATGSHAPLTPSPTRAWVKLGSIWRPNDGNVMLFS